MSKRNKIIYWIATVWLCLGMSVSGFLQVIQFEGEMKELAHLGYPPYFLSIIGVWKLLGVLVVLLPRLPLMKEWAYAGFFFTMSGAVISHAVCGDPGSAYFGPILLLVLMTTSWFLRPSDRRLSVNSVNS